MSKNFSKFLPTIFIFTIVFIGIFFRVYNLNWGTPFYFHPDERNIASSVSQLKFPDQMNPHFFAYGSLPIYTIYLTGLAYNTITNRTLNVSFEQAIIISRLYSALFSSLTTILIYLIAKKITNETSAVTALILSSLSVGLIQFSHFGTFEMWITFFSTLQFYLLFLHFTKKANYLFTIASLITGILVSIKISSLLLAFLPIIALILRYQNELIKKKSLLENFIIPFLKKILILLISIVVIFNITNPYALNDFKSFKGSIRYETDVATGQLQVFYTGAFFNTIPILYQLFYVYPFLINPLLTLLLIPSIIVLFTKKNIIYLFLISTFLVHFIPQAFLFTKWTRYIIPTLPFIYLVITFAFNESLNKYQKTLTIILLTLVSTVFALSFIKTVYFDKDARLLALEFAQKNIPAKLLIVSDVYDLGIVPFNDHYPFITLFNFYDLENSQYSSSNETLKEIIGGYDYYILPSQRIIRNRLLKKEIFPKGNAFYNALTNGNLGFTKIYETPCDIFCKIVYMGNPVWNVEETANVFDHPTVFIFKRIK